MAKIHLGNRVTCLRQGGMIERLWLRLRNRRLLICQSITPTSTLLPPSSLHKEHAFPRIGWTLAVNCEV